jgi:hypothetical protein
MQPNGKPTLQLRFYIYILFNREAGVWITSVIQQYYFIYALSSREASDLSVQVAVQISMPLL